MIDGFNWTLGEARLRELAATQKSASEIAALLGAEFGGHITRNSVIGKLQRLKIKREFHKPGPKEGTPSPLQGRKVENRKPPEPMPERKFQERWAPVVTFPAPASLRVELMDLRRSHCRFIAGDPLIDGTFCGHKVRRPGSSWCKYHSALVFSPSVTRTNSDERLVKVLAKLA